MNINIKNTNTEKFTEYVKSHLSGEPLKACVITFGCQQNEADSEKLRSMALMMGYILTDKPEEADLIAVNTCAIRKHAEMKALSLLGRLKVLKNEKPNMIIAVVGCMAAEPQVVKKLKGDFRYVSFTLEPSGIHRFPELVFKSLTENERSFIYGSDDGNVVEGIIPHRMSKHRAWVSVMYGCNNFCSYCIVPYVRGRERSRSSLDIIEECKSLVASGYREITLLGQNVNSYKSDMDFALLLENVAKIPGDFIVRFMTSHPKDVSDSLIDTIGKYKGKIAPAFHLPLQSGSDRILSEMNRTYNKEGFLSTVKKLRLAVPEIALSTDVIVGFPGESESDFSQTLDVLRDVGFDMVYAFIYSVREGTRAAGMENHIPENIKRERLARLLDVQRQISLEKNLPYIDTVQRVLADSFTSENGKNRYSARTMSNKLVHFDSDDYTLVGKFVNVKITRAGAFDLFGEIIGENK